MSLYENYHQEIIPQLQKELNVGSPMAVPRLVKVVVSIGLKDAKDDKKVLESVGAQLATITGQQPKICRAKKSIAAFKLGKRQPIGLMVTLRGRRAFDFIEKLIAIVFPRVRDFNGLNPESFDGKGNYSLGISEQIVFSEIDFSKIDKVRGLEVTLVTSAEDDEKAKLLLDRLGMPFAKKDRPKLPK